MAEGCVQNSSDKFDEDFMFDWDVDLISNHITLGNIAYDKKRLSWHNSYTLLKEIIESTFKQRGKWWLPGGKARRFDSSTSDFIVTWYPGKLNSLTFNGKIGERARDFLSNLCVAMSISTETRQMVDDETKFHPILENFSLDLEILQSRVDSMQSLLSVHDDLLSGTRNLVNEVTRMRIECV
jgi:hypothetical protein